MTGQFALDLASVGQLRADARARGTDSGLREATRQFEALFMQQMMKSMRDASMKSELFSSSQSDFYQSLMDQQWAQHLAGQGLGLAQQLMAQLTGEGSADMAGIPVASSRFEPPPAATGVGELRLRAAPHFDNGIGNRPQALAELRPQFIAQVTGAISESGAAPATADDIRAFVEELRVHAREVEQQTGIPADLMVAQAVLETGWGGRQILTSSGANSHNLFAIKADSSWSGDRVEILTHENIGERSVEVIDAFRVYASYTDSFSDYARLLTSSPRYQGVLQAGDAIEAAHQLQKGGYATDPDYAAKLIALLRQGVMPGGRG